jgi:predicted transcriptional regulator
MEQKKQNFTYIFGAGASAETIPTVKSFKEGILKLVDHIQNLDHNSIHEPLKNNIILFYQNFAKNINNSASVDTFIKKLDLSNDDNQYLYKQLLSTYIHFETLTKESIDKRYDLFNASILEKVDGKTQIPTNINIISWNYDRLFETSLQWILGIDSNTINQYINVISTGDKQSNIEEHKLNLIKLNGSAGEFIPTKNEHISLLLDWRKDLYNIIFSPLENISNINQLDKIKFAWSDDQQTLEIRQKAMNVIKESDQLIIIGYSFPTFNRKVDFELLSALKKTCKIHLQIPEKDIKSVKQRLLALTQKNDTDPNIFEYTQTDEFYIPYEFNIPIKGFKSMSFVI